MNNIEFYLGYLAILATIAVALKTYQLFIKEKFK